MQHTLHGKYSELACPISALSAFRWNQQLQLTFVVIWHRPVQAALVYLGGFGFSFFWWSLR
jgi:hypothetical protein